MLYNTLGFTERELPFSVDEENITAKKRLHNGEWLTAVAEITPCPATARS